MKVPFFTTSHQNQRYGSEIRDKIDKIIDSGMFILGSEVRDFEDKVSQFTGIKHAIGVANGTDALYLLVNALDLPVGSEVITTPYTFFASTSCISRNSLVPIFVDVDEKTYNIDPSLIEAAITDKTKAILSVDLFSHCCDNTRIAEIAIKHDLFFIEDSAEAFGMKWKGKHAGFEAQGGAISFFPTKTLGCFGDGGMILTQNDEYAEKLRSLRVHGISKKYIHGRIGINSRLDALQAGVLNVKMNHIESEIAERAGIAEMYSKRLSQLVGKGIISLPQTLPESQPVWYVYSIQCEDRNELQSFLSESDIGTSIYYPIPMHQQECFADLGYQKGDFPVTEKLCDHALALPMYIGLDETTVDHVCSRISEFYSRTRK